MADGSSSKAYEAHKSLVLVQAIGKGQDWAVAKQLYHLRRSELWRFAVGGYDTWEDYLKQPEINISRHKADKLVRIYEYFIVEHGFELEALSAVPWSALDIISKKRQTHSYTREQIQSLLDDALHLTTKDLKENLFDVTEGGDRTYTFLIMKKCDQTGNLEKVHDITSDEIKTAFNL